MRAPLGGMLAPRYARGARATSQLGWMLLGAVPAICLAAFAWTLAFSNSASALGLTAFYLVFLVPAAAVLTTGAWGGYALGSSVAHRQNVGEAPNLMVAAFGALASGVLLLLAANVLLGGMLYGYLGIAFGASLLAAIGVVTLARLPLGQRVVRRTDWDPPLDD